jgi:plastocyanin
MKSYLLLTLLLILSFTRISAQCEALFAYTIGQDGLVEFSNNSSTSLNGDVQYIMTVDNSTIIPGPDYSYQFAPGIYTVCLGMAVLINNSPICTDSFCSSITIEENTGTPADCPTLISYTQLSCYEFTFALDTLPSNGTVDWWISGEGTFNNITGNSFTYTFTNPGLYAVIPSFQPGGTCPPNENLKIENLMVGCEEEGPCPTQISATVTDCNTFHLLVEGVDQGNVTWDFHFLNDTTLVDDISVEYPYCHLNFDAGDYTEIIAEYTSDQCPQGVTIYHAELFPICQAPSVSWTVGENCGDIDFTINDNDANLQTAYDWFFDPAQIDPPANSLFANISHHFDEPGNFYVRVDYYTNFCIVSIDSIMVEVGTCDSICPTEISITPGELCHQYTFSVNNWGDTPFGNINWNFGDNIGSGQNDFLHMYLEPGDFEVCASGTTDACPNGFEICTNLNVPACGGDGNNDGCPDFIWGYPLDDCGLWHFEAGPGQELMTVSYDWGDGTQTDATTIADHQYEADGIYIVTLTYFSNTCSETIELYYTVNANTCEGSECPTEIAVVETQECGFYQFEAGSFVDDEQFTWHFGNNEPVLGGHFIAHQFNEPGVYAVICTLSNSTCPFAQLAVEVVVADCFVSCTEVNIGLDSYLNSGGPEMAYWSITNSNGVIIDSGNTGFTTNEPNFDYFTCLEDGCYELQVEGLGVADSDLIGIFIDANLINVVQNVEVQNENLVTITFGINSDCVVECSPSSILFVSNVITGSTDCVAYSVTDINTNESFISGISEFTAQIQTVNNEFCLPDGCYSVTFDSCDPMNAGSGLDYQFFVSNVNVLANAVPVYQDDYAVTYEFSLNADCAIENECVASFDVEFTNALGNVTLYNTSTYTGANAQYFWDYGNGQTSTNESVTVSFNPPGYYYVCLTLNTPNCNSTYCATLYFPVTNIICNDNIVNLSINTVYPGNLSDAISIAINTDSSSFDIGEITTTGGDGFLAVCLPDDCYQVVFNTGINGLLAETCEVVIESPSETITFPIGTGATEYSTWFGVNTECIISTPEFDAGEFSIYPNPANEMIQISMTNYAAISGFEILDATGRLVESGKYTGSIDVSALSPGAYMIKIMSNGEYAVGRFMKEN